MKKRTRARKAGIAVGVAALATMAFGASTANAAPAAFGTSFDNAYLKTTLGQFDILTPPGPPPAGHATLAGQRETNDNTIAVPPGCAAPVPPNPIGAGFCFPDFSGTVAGIPIAVEFDSVSAITGQLSGFPAPDGGVTTNPAQFVATITVGTAPDEDVCVIGDPPSTPANEPDMVLSFTTASTTFPNPYNGDVFTVVPQTVPTDFPPLQDGAVAANYPSLPPATPGTGDNCSLVDGLTGGPGGIWIAEGLGAPTPNAAPQPPPTNIGNPAPNPTPTKKAKKCKKKKKGKKGAAAAAKCKKKKKKK